MTTIAKREIDLSVRHAENSWYWQQIRDYSNRETHRLRANIRRNAYDHQSYANIERWSNERGWVIISCHPITDYPCAKVWSGREQLTDNDHEWFIQSAECLFAIGVKFIESDYSYTDI